MPDSINSKPTKKLPASQADADRQAKRQKRKLFPIVAMGGSAGSFNAFEKFFTHMPADSGMCFIIIMHLDPNHNGNVSELIQNYTQMPVSQAEDGLPVLANSVYIIPPNKDMGMHNRKLLLLPPASPKGFRLPIDYFFQSIAEDQWNKVVGIIFSGMGSDGETGLRMIKEKLGLTMVQDPETAQYTSMPQAAIDTNLVDYVVSPEEMPVKLIQYLNHPVLADDLSEEAVSETKNANAIQKILMLLRSHTGHDFSLYKKNTITRRIDRRIAFHQLPDYNHYVGFLRENPHEIDILFHELLIGVTKFFRDAAAFDVLKEKLTTLLQQKPGAAPIRIWTAGCSTGEEAYSIAIIVMEYLATLESKKIPKVQIFATDLDMDAIDFARAGLYHENIVADVSEERLENYFVKKNECYSVKKELREMIVFAQHNIIKDAPFTRLDMLCCRNVMIYLTTELQRKIVPVFHYSLNPKGIYFMGPAETVGGFTDMFAPIDSRWKIFERKEGASTVGKMIDFPFHISRHPLGMLHSELTDKTPRKKTLAEAFNQVMIEKYTPASVLINDKGDIVYVNGKTNRFLELNPGQAAMNINRMAHEDLKYALGNAIHLVRAQKKTVIINDIKLKDDGGTRLMNLQVDLLENNILQGLILVVFEDKGILKIQKAPKGQKVLNAATEELEKELLFTKQQLHTTIEQMETSLEELKSTNEELQSTNEELQSTNEEALTTKEEMQSLNEELMTINVQYQSKAEELTQLNNDMKNMLDNTEIGTIFLDNNLKILRYTPQIKKLFNVIPTDVGRSISHIVSNFDYPSIEDDIRQVIDRLSVKEIELCTKNDEWYNLRIMPYRTIDNFINGAVLTIIRITPQKQLEKKLTSSLEVSKSLLESYPYPTVVLDAALNTLIVSAKFLTRFHLKEQDITGLPFLKFANERWKTNKFDKLLKQVLDEQSAVSMQHGFAGSGTIKAVITVLPIQAKANSEHWLLVTIAEDKF